jgi:3-oxoacyl-[acyl-carrier protein] reductase
MGRPMAQQSGGTPMFDDLCGKSVLITGASTGIGAAVAKGFGQCGARVGVHYHKSAEAAEQIAAAVGEAGGAAALLQGDVTDRADVARIIATHIQSFGALDVLINNAGDVVRRSAFEDLDEPLIDDIIGLNARSVVTACRLAVPQFVRQGHGNIINTTSLAARQAGGPGSSIYTAAKGFVQSLTHFLAREYAARNIRVNAVAPGLIMTPLQERNTTPEQLEAMARAIPLGRAGQPEDCVGAFLFLASDALSGFVTGATIDVNGGAYLS